MPQKKKTKKPKRVSRKLERDRVGDLFADIPDETGQGKLRISIRRNWYSPPFTDEGKIEYERAAEELTEEVTEGVLVVQRYLENGDPGYATEIPVTSKDELEKILRTMRKLYVESLQYDNAIRAAGLETCKTEISRIEEKEEKAARLSIERRKERERRIQRRRGRQLLGLTWFRKDDRRVEQDRRVGLDRRTAQGRTSDPHLGPGARRRRSSGGSALADASL